MNPQSLVRFLKPPRTPRGSRAAVASRLERRVYVPCARTSRRTTRVGSVTLVPLRAADARELTLVVATRVVVVVVVIIIISALCCLAENYRVSRCVYPCRCRCVCVRVFVRARRMNELKLIQSVRSFRPCVRASCRRARACEVALRRIRRARCVGRRQGGVRGIPWTSHSS